MIANEKGITMKILKIDKKENTIEIVPESLGDLWHLQQAIEEHDIVSGSAERKVKAKEEGMKASKEKIFVELDVEKTEFHQSTGQLRVLGIIVGGKPEEFIQLKAHHAIEVELNKKIRIKKTELKQYLIDRLKKAEKQSYRPKIVFLVLDDEQADIAEIMDYGFSIKASIKSGKHGKQYEQEHDGERYFNELFSVLKQIEPKNLIIAGPGFAKNNFKNFLEQKSAKFNAFYCSTNSVGLTGLNELLKNKAIEKILEESAIAEESRMIEELFAAIARQANVSIGLKETEQALEAGAVAELFLEEQTHLENRKQTEELLKKAEQQAAKIHFISSGHEAGQKLRGISGIAAMLRYKIQ